MLHQNHIFQNVPFTLIYKKTLSADRGREGFCVFGDGTVATRVSYSFPTTIVTSLISSPGRVSMPDSKTSLPS